MAKAETYVLCISIPIQGSFLDHPHFNVALNSWAGLGSPDIMAEAFPALESPIVYVGPPFPIARSHPTCSDFPGCITNICPSLPTPDCPWGTWL